MKKHCNKELVTFKRDDEDLENATNCWICDKVYDDDDDDVKVKDHCHIIGKYRGSAHRHCNINVKLNNKNSCRISQPKNLWVSSYYARTK